MSSEDTKSVDIFGFRPLAKAAEKATDAALAGAGKFLSRICLPAAEEYGLLWKDRVSHWRAKNAAKMLIKAEQLTEKKGKSLHAHPRLVWEIIDKGSWSDDDLVQELWAGLLASSCSTETPDDSNILFTSILAQLTSVQARIINHACETANKFVSKSGLPYSERLIIPLEQLQKITGILDLHRLDRELDHLRSIELIGGGPFNSGGFSTEDSTQADITASGLALHLYARAHGFSGSPIDFWNLRLKIPENIQQA